VTRKRQRKPPTRKTKRKPERTAKLDKRSLYERLKDHPLPPLKLTPEELQARRVAALREQQMRREFDRMLGEAIWGPPRPKIGRPDTFNRAAIRTTARTVMREENSPTQAKLREKVEERLAGAGIAVPGDTRFKKMTADIFKAAKAAAPKSR
jgi:hypothetical protein